MIGRQGICSWSLRAATPSELAQRVRACGLDAVQLALEPIRSGAWDLDETRGMLGDARIAILSGMLETEGEDYTTLDTIKATGGLRPDAVWPANLDRARSAAEIAGRLGLGLVTFHAGFIPHDAADPERATMLDRLRAVADVFAAHGVNLGLETGQESAATLVGLLDELGCANVGVNFDPANMILYGMGDPIASFRLLLPRVVQVHLKDAVAAETPGTWGQETAVGRGQVDWGAFGELLASADRTIDAVFEREAGEERVADIRSGREALAAIAPFASPAHG